jgi:hypothetical protein
MSHIRISECICQECGSKFPIPRTKKQREKNHIKTLYCTKCRERTFHVEVRECDFVMSI